MSSRAKNFTDEELNLILTCLQRQPDLISGLLGGEFKTAADARAAWDSIANLCSACSLGAVRTGLEVKNKWQDFKCRTKKKAAMLKDALAETGNKKKTSPLTEIEERALALIGGHQSVEGILPIGADLTAHQILPADSLGLNCSSLLDANESVDWAASDITNSIDADYMQPSGSQTRPNIPGTFFASTPQTVKRKKSGSSTLRVKKLRERRRQEELKENNEVSNDIIETQAEIRNLLQSVNEKLEKNNEIQSQSVETLKEMTNSINVLNNNMTVLASLAAKHLGVDIFNSE